jgi:hypothetical protein
VFFYHFCGEVNTKKVEQIQERALRFIYEDYSASYHELLSKSKLLSLKVRRMRSLAIEVFKVINKECPVQLNFKFLSCVFLPTAMA